MEQDRKCYESHNRIAEAIRDQATMLSKTVDSLDRHNAFLEQEKRNSMRHMLLLERHNMLLAEHTKALVKCLHILKEKDKEVTRPTNEGNSGKMLQTLCV